MLPPHLAERADPVLPLAGALQPTVDDVVQAYDRHASLYDQVYDQVFGQVLASGRRAMTKAVAALNPVHVLEVGVGTGLTLEGYPRNAHLVGIDVSPQMLEHARWRAAHLQGRDISLYLMNTERLEFGDDSFDCVTLPYVLSVTPNPARLVQEARRVCRADGAIVVLNHFSGSRFWWPMERAVRPVAARVGFRPDFSFDQHILAHDWQVESVRSVNLFGLSKLVVLRNLRR